MGSRFAGFSALVLIISFMNSRVTYGQDEDRSRICGYVKIDDTWEPTIYLSYIPTFDDLYRMSNEMIIARAGIDSLGYFEFDISFLPEEESLFRLHITKKGDTPASLIIGGKDQNHLFFIASRRSNFELRNAAAHPPFKNVTFINSIQNTALQQITILVQKADSAASESTAAKRKLIEDKLHKDLLLIADTTRNILISLYAIYKSKFESNYTSNVEYYRKYLTKRSAQNNPYFRSFSKQIPVRSANDLLIAGVLTACAFVTIGFFIGKHRLTKAGGIAKLSIQERKVLELLRRGATNQEISNQYNIEISTVKSHVSSILSKLKVRSRKDIMNLK